MAATQVVTGLSLSFELYFNKSEHTGGARTYVIHRIGATTWLGRVKTVQISIVYARAAD